MDDILLPDPTLPVNAFHIEPELVAPTEPEPLLAPWWHTLAILLIIAGWAALSGKRNHSYTTATRLPTYFSMVMMSWMLFGSAVSGIRDRNAFFFNTLRHRANSFGKDFRRGLAIYAGIYLLFACGALTFLLATKAYEMLHPSPAPTVATNSNATSELPPPTPTAPAPVHRSLASRMHIDSKTVLALGPRTALELLLWLAVSFTAGFCEEHIFRGYLLQQAIGILRRSRIPRAFGASLAIVITSLIFGSLHLYEGLGGAALIALLGVVYSVIALKLGNLRAVIAAHFLQDFVAGCMLFLLHMHRSG